MNEKTKPLNQSPVIRPPLWWQTGPDEMNILGYPSESLRNLQRRLRAIGNLLIDAGGAGESDEVIAGVGEIICDYAQQLSNFADFIGTSKLNGGGA